MSKKLLSEEEQNKAEKKSQPDWLSPMKAKLTDNYFSDPDWFFERKLDGVRCLIFKKGNQIRLLSRNKKSQNKIYPELVEAFQNQNIDFIADGEIVTFERDLTSFSKLQARINVQNPDEALQKKVPAWIYLFDCMWIEGYDITRLDNRTRKNILHKAIHFKDPIRYCAHRNEKGEKYRDEACDKGWEGIIAKKASASYVHSRSGNWLKFKCINEQELVIGGFTPPGGSRKGFGAILVGYYEGKSLKYAGKVGTGYSDKELEDLRKQFNKIERETSPFEGDTGESEAHWLRPELVAEIGFTEWTKDNKLRHPRYLGLRNDKMAKEVVKETPS